jgi:hypothetical protein
MAPRGGSFADMGKFVLPLAFMWLGQGLPAAYVPLASRVLKGAWLLAVAVQVHLLLRINKAVGALVDDGTVVRVEKKKSSWTRKKKGGKKAAAAKAAAKAAAQAGPEVAPAAPAAAPAPAPAAPSPAPAPVAKASEPTFEELSVPAYDRREFSRVLVRFLFETVLVAVFNLGAAEDYSALTSMGLIYAILSPLSLLDGPLARVHIHGQLDLPRPFGEEAGVVQEMKEQWGAVKREAETTTTEQQRRELDAGARILEQLQARKRRT